MMRLLYGFVALGLLQGVTGQLKAQPTYSFTTLDVPGSFISNSTFANGINSSGQIVGFYFDGLSMISQTGLAEEPRIEVVRL